MSGSQPPGSVAPWLQGGGGGGGIQLPDVMGMMTKAMELRNQQQGFMAKEEFGRVIGGARTLEEGLADWERNPMYGFAPELGAQARQNVMFGAQTDKARADAARAQMALRGDIWGAFSHASVNSTTADDFDRNWHTVMDAPTVKAIAERDPDFRQQAQDFYDSRMKGLPPPGDPQRDSKYLQNSVAHNAATLTKDQMDNLAGTQGDQEIAGQRFFYRRDPTWMGAGVTPSPIAGAPGAGTPGATAPGMVGPTKLQQDYLTTRGRDMAQYQTNLDDSVKTGGTIMQTIEEARDAMTQFKAGAGASVYAGVAQVFQALGANKALVDKISGGDLGALQEMQKLMVNTTMNQVREQIPKGSRLSQMEFQAFNRNNPTIDTDPRATEKVFNFWTRLYTRDVIEQREMNKFIKAGGDVSDWPAQWQGMAARMGMLKPQFTNTTGGAVSPNSVKHLLDHPDTADQFNLRYGPGAAETFLGTGTK